MANPMTLQEYFDAADTLHANANQFARALSLSSGKICPAQNVYKWLGADRSYPKEWISVIIAVTGGLVTADSWHREEIDAARAAAPAGVPA